MRSGGLDEAGIKTAGRILDNLRCADYVPLMAESEKELTSLLLEVEGDSEKAGLKLNIKKN